MADVAEQRIAFEVSSEREILLSNDCRMHLRQGQHLEGTLCLERWDGPTGKSYELPSFYHVTFEFMMQDKPLIYRNEITPHDLVPDDGEECTLDAPEFEASLPGIQWVFDTDDTLKLSGQSGSAIEMVLKHMDCILTPMLLADSFRVECKYYDLQRADYSTIFLARSYESLLFLKAMMISRDENGNVEEWIPHDEEYVMVEEIK